MLCIEFTYHNVTQIVRMPTSSLICCYSDVVCVRGRIFDKNIALIFFLLSPLVIRRRNKKTKKITSTTKNLEDMTAKRERERRGGGE